MIPWRYAFIGVLVAIGLLWAGCKKDPPTPPNDNPLIPVNNDPGDPVENTASIEGYSDKRSYYPGDDVHLMISCSKDSLISLTVYRIGLSEELGDYHAYSKGCQCSK